MAFKVRVDDNIRAQTDALLPTLTIPFAIELEKQAHFMAAHIIMYTWKEYFPNRMYVAQSFIMGSFGLDRALEFDFELPFDKIRMLENREKGDLGFEFRVTMQYYTQRDVMQNIQIGSETCSKKIAESDWLDFLNAVGYTNKVFISIDESVHKLVEEFRKKLSTNASLEDAILDAVKRASKERIAKEDTT